jgi:hypothetical protein
MSNPAGRYVFASEAIETFPAKPVALAPSQERMPPCAAHLGAEAFQPLQVRGNSVILEVPAEDPSQPGTDHSYTFVPFPVQCVTDRRQRGPHPLLRSYANDLKPSLSVSSTAVREPEKVKRLRSPLSPSASALGRKTPEFNQPRFIGVQSQSEFREPFP